MLLTANESRVGENDKSVFLAYRDPEESIKRILRYLSFLEFIGNYPKKRFNCEKRIEIPDSVCISLLA